MSRADRWQVGGGDDDDKRHQGTAGKNRTGQCARTPKSSMSKHKTFIVGNKSARTGKATHVQAWPGHEHSRRLRLPDFKTGGT